MLIQHRLTAYTILQHNLNKNDSISYIWYDKINLNNSEDMSPQPQTKLCLCVDTVICYFFGVEIFSDGALRPKFCYANIFPTLIFLNYACAFMQNVRKGGRRVSSRCYCPNKINQGCPSRVTSSRCCHCTSANLY